MKTTTAEEFQQRLNMLGACKEAKNWAHGKTAQQAWDECERADWLLWWSDKSGASRQILVKIACLCARTSLQYTKDPRVLACIESVEVWVDDPSPKNLTELRIKRSAAADAAADAAAYAAGYAAYAAGDAAARNKSHIYMCSIIRQHLQCPE